MKGKFLYNNVNTKKADKIICSQCLGLDWHDSIKNKTTLFANQNDQ